MKNKIILIIIVCISSSFWSCNPPKINIEEYPTNSVKTGLDVLFDKHLDKITGKNIAIVTNQSGLNKNGKSNISMLLENDEIKLVKIFAPEHGFTGLYADGEHIDNDTSLKLLPPIISLYGKSKIPTVEMFEGIDLIIYDIQDVGARFYTYISTLGVVMETAGKANISVMVLDRPNPIGDKVEGPVLDIDFQSFVGKYPIPIRYGMTIGELAKMIVGEQLIKPIPKLEVIPMENYESTYTYKDTKLPWVKPSSNIVDLETAFVYPGLCLLQGTNISDGRGTYEPIKRVGAPWVNSKQLSINLNNENLKGVTFTEVNFTPIIIQSMATEPKFQDIECHGVDINITDNSNFKSVETGITILYQLIEMYPDKFSFIKDSLERLWGSDTLYDQLNNGDNPKQIIESYQKELDEFLKIRDKYLIYN